MLERLFANQAYNDLKAALSIAARRQAAIAQNIANADTPGYRRVIVTFDEELFAASERRLTVRSPQTPVLTTAAILDPRHIPIRERGSDEGTERIRTIEDPNAVPKENGNTVDLFSEMAEQSANELTFDTLAQLVSQQLITLRKVINQAGGLGG